MRPTTLLSAGGTIAMASERGSGATPALDAAALVAVAGLEVSSARSVLSLPGVHLTLPDALAVAREAVGEAERDRAVVVTTGTDTLEELGALIDVMNGTESPIVLTGAIRPATAAGADGPANLVDAVAVAGRARGGTYVVFGGEVHAALHARKTDSTSPRAFSSPWAGPLGYVSEGRVAWTGRPPARMDGLSPERLDLRVPIVPTYLGDDGELLRASFSTRPDGIVLVALGAGHAAPAVLAAVRDAPCPVVATVRPQRGEILLDTYGFEGAEGDLRRAGAIRAGSLSPQAARMVLLAALGSGYAGADLVSVVTARC